MVPSEGKAASCLRPSFRLNISISALRNDRIRLTKMVSPATRKLLDAPVASEPMSASVQDWIGTCRAYDATVLTSSIGNSAEHLAATKKGQKASFDATDQELGRSFGSMLCR